MDASQIPKRTYTLLWQLCNVDLFFTDSLPMSLSSCITPDMVITLCPYNSSFRANVNSGRLSVNMCLQYNKDSRGLQWLSTAYSDSLNIQHLSYYASFGYICIDLISNSGYLHVYYLSCVLTAFKLDQLTKERIFYQQINTKLTFQYFPAFS